MARPSLGRPGGVTDESRVVGEIAELGSVRRALGEQLATTGIDEERLHGVLLATTELLSNAIIHSRAAAVLRIDLTPRSVCIRVADDDPRHPEVQHLDPHRVGGNGLRLVDALADDWGFRPQPTGGKEVWFQIDW